MSPEARREGSSSWGCKEGREGYKVSFERGLDGRLPLLDIFLRTPFVRTRPRFRLLFSSPPSKRKKRRNYGRFSSNNLDVISTFDRTLEIPLSSRNDESNGREEKYSGNLFSFSFFSPEKGLEDPRGESILSFVRRKKWQRLIERAKWKEI